MSLANTGGQVTFAAGAKVTATTDQTTPGTTDLVHTPPTTSVTVTPTVTAGAYTTGNEVGGLMTFSALLDPNTFAGVLESIYVTCKTTQTCSFVLYLFSANPSNSTWTDKSAPSINSADVGKVMGAYTLSTANSGLGTHTAWNLDGIGKGISLAAAAVYAVMVVTGTPTFGSTTDVTVTLTVLRG